MADKELVQDCLTDPEELPRYVPLQDQEKYAGYPVEVEEEEEEEDEEEDEDSISDCEHALIPDPEKPRSSSARNCLRGRASDKVLSYLRLGLQCLIPSFLSSGSKETKTVHSTAWLDGLRGLAAFFVVFHHASLLGFSWTIHDGWSPDRHQTAWFMRLPIIRLLITGSAQVSIFFVVSGYAISHKALKLSHQGRFAEVGSTLFSSVLRRHARLYSPAAIVVFCSAMLTQWDPAWFGTNGFPGVAVPTRTVPQAPDLIGQLRHWFDTQVQCAKPIANGFFEQGDTHIEANPYDPNLWTLPLEFSSSMVVFLFLMASAKLYHRARIVLAMFLIIYLQYYFDFPAIHLFLNGMLICDLHFGIEALLSASRGSSSTYVLATRARAPGNIISRIVDKLRHFYLIGRTIGLAAFICALWLLGTPEVAFGPRESWGYMTISSWVSPWYGDHILSPLGAILLLLVIDHTPFLQTLFTNRFSQYMGRISYSLYLIHGPLLWSVGLRLAHFTIENITGQDTDAEYFWGMVLAFVLWWPLAIYLSDLTARHIDENCVWLTKWVYGKMSQKDT